MPGVEPADGNLLAGGDLLSGEALPPDRVAQAVKAKAAWPKTQGQGIRIAVVAMPGFLAGDVGLLLEVAPRAEVVVLEGPWSDAAAMSAAILGTYARVAVLPDPYLFPQLLLEQTIAALLGKDVAVFVAVAAEDEAPAVRRLERLGAITVGRLTATGLVPPADGHGRRRRDLPRPVVYAFDGYRPGGQALVAAAAAALLLATNPALKPADIKRRLLSASPRRWQVEHPAGWRAHTWRSWGTGGRLYPCWTYFQLPFTYRLLDVSALLDPVR